MNDVDIDAPMTLERACEVVFKNAIGADTLRAQAKRGNLTIEKIGRRQFVTHRAIADMRQKCQINNASKAQGSTFSQNGGTTPINSSSTVSGSSVTDRASVALVAAQMTATKLKESLQSTSPKNTNRNNNQALTLIKS